MKKKLLIALIMVSSTITACRVKDIPVANETQKAQTKANDIEAQKNISEKDMLLEINNWIVGDVWNKGFCDFCHYEESGTSSTGEIIDIELALNQFKENYKKKDEYNSYMNSLPGDFENIINIWDKLIKEADTLYAYYENGVDQTGRSTDTEKFIQYREALSDEINRLNLNEDAVATQDNARNDVSVDKNLFDVTINIPSEYVGKVSQEELDKKSKEYGYKVKLNDDGSATYTMTKQQHRKLVEEYRAQINKSLNELIGSKEYPNFTSIKTNENFTKFTVTTKSTELDLTESFSVMAFYAYGGIYNAFSGDKIDNVSVTFINADSGDEIDTINSSDMSKVE